MTFSAKVWSCRGWLPRVDFEVYREHRDDHLGDGSMNWLLLP